jgi:GNAT superfamily N-acetyltransferase
MIRAALPHEIALLPQIENAADLRFRRAGLDLVVRMPPHSLASLERGRRRGLLWVATSPVNRVVGFALMDIMGDTAWIDQLTVLDRWQGRGIGGALIDRSAATARQLGYEAIYLSTYRTVSWNKPFYERRGFREIARGDFTPTLRREFLLGVNRGHPVWQRASMVR